MGKRKKGKSLKEIFNKIERDVYSPSARKQVKHWRKAGERREAEYKDFKKKNKRR